MQLYKQYRSIASAKKLHSQLCQTHCD